MGPFDRVRALLGVLTFVAGVATAGSLYFSEGLGLVPCDLCWYQRILMYPLVVVAGAAAIEGRAGVWKTGLPLSLGGVAVAGYHTYVQLTPAATCGVDGACTAVLWRGLSVFTIPRLALVAFALLSVGFFVLALVDRDRTAV
ncbi:disulfide bond formation protein B [Halorubrum sp. JWXQ-INN 858]|uniref:disulfide bond formation protein B n=1 Tax=Halorubrum sp. JWXQ-INN 858 TaxID=2690782 RepID=UPI0013567D78|nr:disulfide bond formation protein B [Halorubrum sp. JWXQ-INN 858]MWV64836.1 disulfide bond formation protein B [Halorubrum sp. JWXQ-INN 858]